MVEKFKAFIVNQDENGKVSQEYKTLTKDDLPEGDVLIKVHYSGINYKDALAAQDHNAIVKKYPMVPGIDLAGTIEETNAPGFEVGDKVIVTSYDLGVSHYGGFSEYARVKSEWVIELPEGLTLEEAMIYGTAGYTAGLAIEKLEKAGMSIEGNEVLVRGATGGVGTLAMLMLDNLGYDVVASTGRKDVDNQLKELGATEVIDRLPDNDDKSLASRTWQAAIDPVGGKNLPYIVKRLDNNGSVAVIGMTGGTEFESSVFPFILRGVSIIGIDSVFTPIKLRRRVWRRLARDLKPDQLHDIKHIISFEDIPDAIDKVINHENTGRIVIDFNA
ncbi:acryloyl-CoA reductase [Staphylococcus caprae]|uniref:Alcohol dehydrogenase n=1 Tax=Staphylococcus caprae TaxID=29380 RepID=A0ABM7FNF4_9STAP|nr:acryloyl-CoA reductase [Staphylococcus caprae]EES41852.1 quinone oxidoreductase, YhdH/YhfP family [Staphylococcus caprae M23864:W1]MBN6826146.1 acryloyl-CoA reductase [Staphylococcus caprae]MBX5317616.1 acryloyl-CoA reductase [Staphylococcus caprae]MBX5324070.1 acryloyl-CoA reductase [Staphylococcus caprae]MDI0014376.1 acryloyl-CoA reductase [Staphylococcus caprae]